MWRPEDWPNPFTVEHGNLSDDADTETNIYESGADAILEALIKDGVFTYGYHTPDIDLEDAKEESGYWVFIPDEE